MWCLEGMETILGQIHYLPCGSQLMVSRREGHILLRNDNSISRQHASITVTHSASDLKNVKALPKVILTDLGAKYGTFVNEGIEKDKKIADKSSTELKNGDRIRFGMLENNWQLVYKPLVVTTSTIKQDHKKELMDAMLKLGGHVVGEWTPECIYLVMNNITLTCKVVCAIAAAKPIVTPEFFTKWAEAVTQKKELPVPGNFQPPLQEVSLDKTKADFSPNEARKNVFSGRTLLFSSPKQLSRMGPAVELAGGKSEELTTETLKHAATENYLVIQPPPDKNQMSQSNSYFIAARKMLQEKGLRTIPESDIGLAILYACIERHCNPAFKVNNILRRHGSTSQMTEGLRIYATETQNTEMESMSLTGTRVVPETGQSTRRTPTTVSPMAPPSLPCSLPSSSAISTSMPPPTAINMSKDLDATRDILENKENMGNSQRKRMRTSSSDIMEPPAKQHIGLQSTNMASEAPEPTQPMESQGESQEFEIQISKFEPRHHSTQRGSSTSPSTALKSETKKSDAGKISQTPASTAQSIQATTEPPKSIPFEPYTLPSLKAENLRDEEEPTQPFQDIKREPLSLPVDDDVIIDETDCRREKRPLAQIDLTSDDEPETWQDAKRTKVEVPSKASPVKVERNPPAVSENHVQRSVKQEKNADDDLFSLPGGNTRMRRRGEAKKTLAENHAATSEQQNGEKDKGDEDLFSIPTSSRAQRRRQQMKEVKKENTDGERNKDPPVVVNPVQANGSSSPQKSQVTVITASQGDFLSKRSTAIKAEPDQIQSRRETSSTADELSTTLERSLLLIEVTSLLKRHNLSSSSNTTYVGVSNFKRFKKSAREVTFLPKIIGGRDLVPHDQSVNPQRDEWFRTNANISQRHDELIQQNAENRQDDDLFNLPVNSMGRIRTRR